MPGAACKVINFDHIVVGMDLHKNMPPPAPLGPLPLPHVVVTCIGDAMAVTSKEARTVKAGGASAVARQHDIGMGLFPARGPGYHTAVNALLPLVWLGAGNKCEFGSSSVQVKTGRVAVALIPMVGLNLQLDCNEPGPMPRSICLSFTNTVEAGFTVADCFAGFVAMAVDSIAVRVVNYVSGKLAGALAVGAAAAVGAILAAAGPEALLVVGVVLASPVGAIAAANAAAVLTNTAEMFVGWIIGSPLGYSFPFPWTSWGGDLNDVVNDAISPAPTAPAPTPASLPAVPSSAAGQEDKLTPTDDDPSQSKR